MSKASLNLHVRGHAPPLLHKSLLTVRGMPPTNLPHATRKGQCPHKSSQAREGQCPPPTNPPLNRTVFTHNTRG